MEFSELTESEKRYVSYFKKEKWIQDDEFTKNIVLKYISKIFNKLCVIYDLPEPKIVFGNGCNNPSCYATDINLIDGDFVINVNWFTSEFDVVRVFRIYRTCIKYNLPIDYDFELTEYEAKNIVIEWNEIDSTICSDLRNIHCVCLVKRLDFENKGSVIL